MDVKALGEKLKAFNEKAQSALENESDDLWHEANMMEVALQDEIDKADADLSVEWSTGYSRYILKWD